MLAAFADDLHGALLRRFSLKLAGSIPSLVVLASSPSLLRLSPPLLASAHRTRDNTPMLVIVSAWLGQSNSITASDSVTEITSPPRRMPPNSTKDRQDQSLLPARTIGALG